MSDAEWAVSSRCCRPGLAAGKGGRPSGHCMRDVVDGIRYLRTTARLAGDAGRLPARLTVYYGPTDGRPIGSTETMHGELRRLVPPCGRPQARADRRDYRFTVGKAAETSPQLAAAYDAGKKINGRYLELSSSRPSRA